VVVGITSAVGDHAPINLQSERMHPCAQEVNARKPSGSAPLTAARPGQASPAQLERGLAVSVRYTGACLAAASRESLQSPVSLAQLSWQAACRYSSANLENPAWSEVTDNVGQSAALGRSAVYRDLFGCASPRCPNHKIPSGKSDGRAAVLRR
jgi:hypothetical protein